MMFVLKYLTLLHSERPKLYTILAFLSAIGLKRLDTHLKGTALPYSFIQPFYNRVSYKSKRKRVTLYREAQSKSQKLLPFVKMAVHPYSFNFILER